MSNKSLAKLSRSELLDLLYEQEKRVEDLEKKNKELEAQLADRRIRISKVGSIADASIALTNLFAEAQKAANLYLANVQAIAKEGKADRYVLPGEEKPRENQYVPRRAAGQQAKPAPKTEKQAPQQAAASYVSRHQSKRNGGTGK